METTQGCYMLFWANFGRSTLPNSSCIATYLSSHKPSKSDEQDMLDIAELISGILLWISTYGHTNVGWPAKTFIHQICVVTQCCLEEILIGTDGKRKSKESILSAWLDKDMCVCVCVCVCVCMLILFFLIWVYHIIFFFF